MLTNGPLARLLAFCLLLGPYAGAHAQLLPAKQDALYSNVLNQKRPVEVYLPEESAKDPAQRYETLYVLDGDWNAKIVVDVVTFMRKVGFLPPIIVVSVPNVFDEHGANSRDHDLTPTAMARTPGSGGAANFLAFLKTELIPYIKAHYPADGASLVHGHSYGGLFLAYALVNDPSVFDGYLILDPAMWWDDHLLDAALEAKLADTPTKGKAIYIAARSGHAFEYMGASTIEPIFKRKAPADLHWAITAYPDESHDSLKLKGTYDALRFAYQGYTTDAINLSPTGGLVVKGKPLYLRLDGDLDRFDIRYTTDGSTPNGRSQKAGDAIAVSDPEATTIKLLSNRGTFDRDIPHHLKSGNALPPPVPAMRATSAWHVALYPANAWPRFAHGKPLKTFETDQLLDFGTGASDDEVAGTVTRNLDIPTDGYYVIGVATPGKARVSLAGKLLIDHDASRGRRQAFAVPLRQGVYPLRVEFRQAAANYDFGFVVFQCKEGETDWSKNDLFKLVSANRQ